MQITFDISKFGDLSSKLSRARGPQSLTNVLHYLRRFGCLSLDGLSSEDVSEIEKITCKTPSSTLRHCKLFAVNGVSEKTEAIFLKNPNLAIRYLRIVGRPDFLDPKIQKRFRKKFKTNARLALQWSRAFNVRLSEDEEEVFHKDPSAALDYAKWVIKGKFPDKVHRMILLASFKDTNSHQKRCLSEYIEFSDSQKEKN